MLPMLPVALFPFPFCIAERDLVLANLLAILDTEDNAALPPMLLLPVDDEADNFLTVAWSDGDTVPPLSRLSRDC